MVSVQITEVHVALTHCNPRWVRIYTEVIENELSRGNRVHLLDFSLLTFPKRRTVFFVGWLNHYKKLNRIQIWTPRPWHSFPKEISEDYQRYYQSELFSYFRDNQRSGRLAKKLISEQLRTITYLQKKYPTILSSSPCTKFYISNGRGTIHRTLMEILSEKAPEAKIQYLETAAPHNPLGDRYYLKDYPIHNRIARQIDIEKSKIDAEDVQSIATRWLEPRRQANSRTNYFSKKWDDELSYEPYKNVFFSSSTDEYWALGEMWHQDEWEDQYEAFDAIMSRLSNKGETSFVLRLHPNLLNKSTDFVRREFERVAWLRSRHEYLKVFFPHEAMNSYLLLDKADRVFVSISTIGLEASAMGKSVWTCCATSYDVIADVKKIWSMNELQLNDLEPWTVKSLAAKKYVAYTLLEGVPYSHSFKRIVVSRFLTFPFHSLLFRTLHVILRKIDLAKNVRLSKAQLENI